MFVFVPLSPILSRGSYLQEPVFCRSNLPFDHTVHTSGLSDSHDTAVVHEGNKSRYSVLVLDDFSILNYTFCHIHK